MKKGELYWWFDKSLPSGKVQMFKRDFNFKVEGSYKDCFTIKNNDIVMYVKDYLNNCNPNRHDRHYKLYYHFKQNVFFMEHKKYLFKSKQ